MRIRQSSPAPGGPPVPKPTLHTRKNHDVYNGILHAPLATHVQLIPASSRSEQDPGSTQPDHKWMYLITLFYPYHRACEIYRSHEDVSGLEKLLAGMGCGVKGGITAQPGPLKNGTAEGDGEGSSKCQSCQVHGNESESHDGENANQNQTRCRHNNLKTKTTPAIMLTTPTISSQAALRDAPRSIFLTTTTTTETDTDESTPPSSITDGLLDFYFQPPTPQPTTIPISSTETTNIPTAVVTGNSQVGIPLAWFLRRRMGDCGGG
ncbi:hypothetical protein B0J18DRAFT_486613 [Chaetomium sp. MPI-SDFR-AT-0129]|nr:hypothetical protein B0J18DRAFT_486613 [Chaetomium sp. MPI-SDFR-AT-0129]